MLTPTKKQLVIMADSLRQAAEKLDQVAKEIPERPMNEPGLSASQDEVLLAIEDRRRITKVMLAQLPPWRARLLAHIAEMAGCPMEVSHQQVKQEARRVGGEGTLWK